MRTPYSDSNLLDLGFLFEDGQASSSHGKDAVVAMDCGREPESAALPALPLTEHNLRKFEASVDINSDRDRSRTPPRTPPRQRRKSISNGAPQSPVLAMMSEDLLATRLRPRLPRPEDLVKALAGDSRVDGGDFKVDGASLLRTMAAHYLRIVDVALKFPQTDGCGKCVLGTMDFDELFVSTMCSGSGGAELAVQAFSEGFEDVTGRPLLTATPFACENAAFKQGHLKRLLTHLHPAGNWCIFDDITTMTGKDRRCIVHGPEKKVSKGKAGKAAKGKAKASADQPVSSGDPEPCTLFKNYKPAGGEAEDVFLARRVKGCVCGFSCKSFSRANQSFAANRTSMVDDASNSSVKTFRGTCDVLQSLIQEGQALRCCSRWQSQVQMGGGAHEVCRAPAEALASPTARFSDSKRVVQHTDQPRTGSGPDQAR